MNNEIREKVEKKRQEIREESIRLRNKAQESHTCAYCGKPLPQGQRIYCCDNCAYYFTVKYNFSKSSNILRDYRDELEEEYEEKHPKPEPDPWSQHVARKDYLCAFCETTITKGTKYSKYTRLPAFDEWFDDDPYGTFAYHINCAKFESVLVNKDLLEPEGFDMDEIVGVLFVIALKAGKTLEKFTKDIIEGNYPSDSVFDQINEENIDFEGRYWGDSDNSGFTYLHLVKYEAFKEEMKNLHYLRFKPEDPIKAFTEYYKWMYGDEFSHIISVDMTKIPIHAKKVNEKARE